jgi:hypothetical protein
MITGVTSIPLLVWAERQGISRDTAYRNARAGTLPVPVRRTPTGRIMVELSPADCQGGCITDVHVECLTDAVLAELARRGIRLDPRDTTQHNEE